MRGLRGALLALGVVGFAAGAVPLALALANEGGHQRELIAVFGPLTGWAFIGTGLVVWWRRPENSFGALMTLLGFSACLAALRVATEPWIFITGLLFIALQWAVLFHMLLAYPTGTLRTRWERLLVGISYLSAVVAHPVQVLFQDTGARGLPENPLLISANADLVTTISRSRFWLGLFLLAALAAILIRRWREADPAQRRDLGPVLVSGGVVMALLGTWYAATLAGASDGAQETLEQARIVVLALVPFAFLAGLLHTRVASMTLENVRLDAELRAKVEELRASRARIVEAGDEARRRLERDLHDGAQQRLVALALNLRLLGGRLEGDPDASRELASAQRELEDALQELRDLARGIHPAVLSDRGLSPALAELARRLPVPVELEAPPEGRLPEQVEAAAYFVVAEALTNVAKHARATHATVRVTHADGRLDVEVGDDGVGGAESSSGSGLGGLADRVAALDGELEIETAPGEGTRIRAAIPCGG